MLTDRVNLQRFPSKTEYKYYTKHINNERSITVSNINKNYATKLVANKEITTKKPVQSVTITHKKATSPTVKNVIGDFKNTTNLKLISLLQIQTNTSKTTITMLKQSNEINSVLNSSVTEIGATVDKEDQKSKTTILEVLRSNNATMKYIPESSVFSTIEIPNTEVTDTDIDTIHLSTIISNTTFVEEHKHKNSVITNAEEAMVTEKEVPTTTVRKLTRSKLSVSLSIYNNFCF